MLRKLANGLEVLSASIGLFIPFVMALLGNFEVAFAQMIPMMARVLWLVEKETVMELSCVASG